MAHVMEIHGAVQSGRNFASSRDDVAGVIDGMPPTSRGVAMKRTLFALASLCWAPFAFALSPYVKGDSVSAGDIEKVMAQVEKKLRGAGFGVAGSFMPEGLDGYGVVVATDQGILDAIASIGGATIAGAGVRVGVKADGTVSYINPDYWYRAYFGRDFASHQTSVNELQERLQQALGARGSFGGDIPRDKLSDYRYMFGLETFKDSHQLKKYASFDAAVNTIQKNLAQGVKHTALAYKVILPEKRLAVFGVADQDPTTGDAAWVSKLVPDQIAALPYEIYVVDNQAYALHPRFRIALSWPALTMGTFLKIGNTPAELLTTLTAVAGGVYKTNSEWGEQGWY
jgi:hypothetical protein